MSIDFRVARYLKPVMAGCASQQYFYFMKRMRHPKLPSTVLLLLLFSGIANDVQAARDGQLRKSRSEGSIRISLSIIPSLQISVVNQISVDITNIEVDANFGEYVCITGQQGGRYQLVASGNAGNFVLGSEGGENLPYHVFYNGNPLSDNFDELQAGVPSPTYNVMESANSCAQSPNFRVTFRSENLKNAPAGLYTGALTLLVSPL